MVLVNTDNKSPFYDAVGGDYELPENQTPGTTPVPGEVIEISDDLLGGQCRLLGISVKVVSEGAASYQSGSVVAWEQPIPPTPSMYLAKNNILEVNTKAAASTVAQYNTRNVCYADQYALPPASNSR